MRTEKQIYCHILNKSHQKIGNFFLTDRFDPGRFKVKKPNPDQGHRRQPSMTTGHEKCKIGMAYFLNSNMEYFYTIRVSRKVLKSKLGEN